MNNMAIEQLIYHEARLLDQQQYDDWLGLMGAHFSYWIPLRADQQDFRYESSLLYEDLFLIQLRINRLKNERTFSQKPKSQSLHIIQQPLITLDTEQGTASSETNLLYVEAKRHQQYVYPATVHHQFVIEGGVPKIASKKVILLDAERPLDSLQLII